MKKIKSYKWILSVLGVLMLVIAIFLYSARFKGVVEDISFNSDITLKGVLIKPEGPGPYPTIVLLHGAGSSHQGYDKLYFKFHANAFLEKGFAVLVYTKRGSGESGFDYNFLTYDTLLTDAQAALDFLGKRDDIDHNNIGVMGVSESGWFTPELAYRNKNIKFIINRVSSPFGFIQTVIHEVEMDALDQGFTQQEIDTEIIPVTEQIWQYYIDVSKGSVEAFGPQRNAINKKLERLNKHDRFKKWFTYAELEGYDSLIYKARAKRFLYDPMPYFTKLSIPMLYVLAGKDKNIPTEKVVIFLNGIRSEENKNIQIKVYPDASHYLYKYGLEDGPYEGWLYYNDYLELLTDWARNQVN